MDEVELRRVLEDACDLLTTIDATLLSRGLHERTITARFAHHIQTLLPFGYFADCEYDRMEDVTIDGIKDTPKCLLSWANEYNRLHPDAEHEKKGRVYPDIIIHTRQKGAKNNLAVIEAKWNKADEKHEKIKIGHYLTEPRLDYSYGFFLLLDPFELKDVPKPLR